MTFPWLFNLFGACQSVFMTSRSRVIFGCRAAWGATASQLPAALRRASRPRKKSAETRTRSAPELHSPPGEPFLEPFELHFLGRCHDFSCWFHEFSRWWLLTFDLWWFDGEIWGVNRQSYGARIGQWWFILGNLMVHETWRNKLFNKSWHFCIKFWVSAQKIKEVMWMDIYIMVIKCYEATNEMMWNDVDITGILKQLWFTANGDVSSKVKGA